VVGNISLFTNTRIALLLHTGIVSPHKAYVPLPFKLKTEIGKIEVETNCGKLSLDEFVTSPQSFIQAILWPADVS